MTPRKVTLEVLECRKTQRGWSATARLHVEGIQEFTAKAFQMTSLLIPIEPGRYTLTKEK